MKTQIILFGNEFDYEGEVDSNSNKPCGRGIARFKDRYNYKGTWLNGALHGISR